MTETKKKSVDHALLNYTQRKCILCVVEFIRSCELATQLRYT